LQKSAQIAVTPARSTRRSGSHDRGILFPIEMIDLHCHVLPGIDDGPETIEGSVALARAAHACGTQAIVATPHVSWRYPNESATIAVLTRDLNEHLRREGVAVEIHAGAEIAMTRASEIEPAEIGRLSLGGGGWVLFEPPFSPVAPGLADMVMALQNAGHGVLLAHPERCPTFHREPALVAELVSAGALTSITAGSLVGRFGGNVRRFARSLLAEGLVHNVASDAHDTVRRPPGIAGELADAGLAKLTDWLTHEVPYAILNGEAVPARPRVPARVASRFARLRRH
jgi:protein-tyrosine phosphatase